MKLVYLISRLVACTASLDLYYVPSKSYYWLPSLCRSVCVLYTGDKRLSFKGIALLLVVVLPISMDQSPTPEDKALLRPATFRGIFNSSRVVLIFICKYDRGS